MSDERARTHEPYIKGQQSPPWTVWKEQRGSGVTMSGYLNGLRGRVSPNHEGGTFGYSACLFDGSREGFLAAPVLGKFQSREEAQRVCERKLERLTDLEQTP